MSNVLFGNLVFACQLFENVSETSFTLKAQSHQFLVSL